MVTAAVAGVGTAAVVATVTKPAQHPILTTISAKMRKRWLCLIVVGRFHIEMSSSDLDTPRVSRRPE